MVTPARLENGYGDIRQQTLPRMAGSRGRFSNSNGQLLAG